MNLQNFSLEQRVKYKRLVQEFVGIIGTNQKLANSFFDTARLETVKMYNDVAAPKDSFYKLLPRNKRFFQLFTIGEEYEGKEIDFFKEYYYELVKENRGLEVSLSDFVKHVSVVRQCLVKRFLSEVRKSE